MDLRVGEFRPVLRPRHQRRLRRLPRHSTTLAGFLGRASSLVFLELCLLDIVLGDLGLRIGTEVFGVRTALQTEQPDEHTGTKQPSDDVSRLCHREFIFLLGHVARLI
jgi:hypothetical protein